MNNSTTVYTQAEFDAAVAAGAEVINVGYMGEDWVTACDGIDVYALKGSKVVARKGSTVVAYRGSKVVARKGSNVTYV